MKTFKDTADREWTIDMTIGAIKRVKDLYNVDLLSLDKPESEGSEPLLTRLGIDIALLIDVVYGLIKPQADKEKVDAQTFGEALGGDSVKDAMNAFYDELVNFFQSLGRNDIVEAIRAQQKMIQVMVDRVSNTLKQVDLEKLADEHNL